MKQSSMLKRILSVKRGEVARAKKGMPQGGVVEALASAPPTRAFREAILRRRPYEIHIIGEIKKASPSKGVFRAKVDIAGTAREFEDAGVSALSVLTDEKFFQGSLENLRLVKGASSLPVLRKDFIVDEYQLYQSRLSGADAVLLIVRLLPQRKLKEFVTLARNLSLGALVEVHTSAELKRALDAGADMIGVNTRDLSTFKTDFAVAKELRPRIPPDRAAVCASGIDSPRQIEVLRTLRYDAVLIGEALMRTRKPAQFVHELLHT
ncbi:MAG: indole-3-glycerol phosphate synthase TrpC [Candidatus Coatesbacteria bacterium]